LHPLQYKKKTGKNQEQKIKPSKDGFIFM